MADSEKTNIIEEFKGSISDGEVQIKLDRFMDILDENAKLKAENDGLISTNNINPYQRWVHLAHTLDAWRIIPRALMVFYMWMLYSSVTWFQATSDPTTEQSALISVVVGAGAAWFGFYVKTRGDGDRPE